MRIVYGIGTGFDRDGKPIPYGKACELIKTAVQFLTSEFGGVFYLEGDGSWKDGKGEIIAERSVQFIIEYAAEPSWAVDSLVGNAGEFLRELFNQTSVIASVSQSLVSFIEGNSRGEVRKEAPIGSHASATH